MQLNDVNPLEETRGSAGCVVTPTRMRGACASLPVVICIHAFECNFRGGEIGGAGGARAPPLLKKGGLSPPTLNYTHLLL